MISSPVYTEFHPRPYTLAPAANSFPHTFLATPHPLTPYPSHSYKNHKGAPSVFSFTLPSLFSLLDQRAFHNSFLIKRFRTLSNKWRVYGVHPIQFLKYYFNYCRPIHFHQIPRPPFFSFTYKLPIFYPLCFDIHPCNGGVGWGSPVKSLKKNFNCLRIPAKTKSLPRKMRHNRRAVPNFTGHELRNTDHASVPYVPYLVSSFRLFCDTLCQWEFCGGSHAGWEHKTT
jgi:hypothetical protein